jgi:hypothetical protein
MSPNLVHWLNPVVLVDGHDVPVLGVAVLGCLVGYLAGMFGIGGGFLLTPLLVERPASFSPRSPPSSGTS